MYTESLHLGKVIAFSTLRIRNASLKSLVDGKGNYQTLVGQQRETNHPKQKSSVLIFQIIKMIINVVVVAHPIARYSLSLIIMPLTSTKHYSATQRKCCFSKLVPLFYIT